MGLYDKRRHLGGIWRYFEQDIKKSIKELKDSLDYFDRQPADDEFAKGFENCCKVFRQKIDKVFGEKLIK